MGDFDLTISKLYDPSIEQACIKHLISIGVARKNYFKSVEDDNLRWKERRPSIDELTLVGLGSVSLFLDYVSGLEGLSDPREKIEKTRFKHLPWYMLTVWLPVDFEKTAIIKLKGDSLAVLSVQALLRNLEQIRVKSDFAIDSIPPGYESMRSNLKAFYRSDFSLNDKNALLQWVWHGLFDGANIALKHDAPMLGNGA